MRLILVATLAFAPATFAQHSRTPSGSYGNILHPGVPSPGALRAPAPAPRSRGGVRIGTGGQNGGGRISTGGQIGGRRNGDGRIGEGRNGGGRRSFGGGAVYVPYPVYGAGYGFDYGFDGFYAGDYPGAYGPPPAGDYDAGYNGYEQAAPPPPTVIINQNFQTDSVHPQFRDYSNVQLPEPGAVAAPPVAVPAAAAPSAPAGALADDQPTIFLIAMQDHTIRPVIAYWVQGDTLKYISIEGVMDEVSLALVDRNFSKQLNAERNVPFALPGTR
ncbi:MAG: hypothetical protein ABI833_04040 [Acidobacteriota bacterium]